MPYYFKETADETRISQLNISRVRVNYMTIYGLEFQEF